MWNDFSVLKAHVKKSSLSSAAKCWFSNNNPKQSSWQWPGCCCWAQITNQLPYLSGYLASFILSFQYFLLHFDRYQHSPLLRFIVTITAHMTFLSGVDLLWNKHLCLLQEIVFISFLLFMHKGEYVLCWLRLKISWFNAWIIYLFPFSPCIIWVYSTFKVFFFKCSLYRFAF